jgi:hypothetical protein
MRVIAARELPVFFEAEQADRPDKEKLRLLGVLALRAADATSAHLLTELEEALKESYSNSSAQEQAELAAGLSGIKHMRQMQNFQQQTPSQVRRKNLPRSR